MALIIGLIENSIPPLLAFAPGVKMGLSNVVTLTAIIILGISDAFIILFVRCFLGSVFGGNLIALMYSIPAGFLSLVIQIFLYKFVFPRISLMFVSLIGAIVHNIVQISIASVVVSTNLLPMLPFTLIASIIAGLFVGIVSYLCVKYLPKRVYLDIIE